MKHEKNTIPSENESISLSKRMTLKWLGAGSVLLSSKALSLPTMATPETKACDNLSRTHAIPYLGKHQAGVITPEQKEAIFLSLNLTVSTLDEVEDIFKRLTQCIARLTQNRQAEKNTNDRMPPAESGILGRYLAADDLTITVSLGHSLFDNRFGLTSLKPKKFVAMTAFPNDRLEASWCGGDLLLQLCANSRETVIYALRDVLRQLSGKVAPLWKIDGFLPARDIECKTTPINLFGFKDGTGNADAKDNDLMDSLVWITQKEPAWIENGSYQAVRLIRFALEFWDRTPLEDQENDFGRHKASGAPMGKQHEHDEPEFNRDPHGDRVLFDSHMRRAEPRTTERHVSKLRRRSYSYSLGLTSTGQLDMGLIFVSFQNDLKKGFIDTQKRLNGEPLERYIKPFGGGYYLVLPGISSTYDYLGESLIRAARALT
ncbi:MULTISPECIES: iron uptake transporter deferrochelatase/peroxidase subunit [Xenorhabdus]|uniref:iron uptake transporter deferrochelatase/peroxidase subunit n=1 Tax=Xenorhabdus TaxID=626 RepID=UPI00064A6861|nr:MULTISPECIES: iron uptake transporter deferrochelatase/peroxidase subunit [Xenorhabdus]KLU16698.1 peroxidase [Xenorhabdus griffiniae]KOP33549.1 peroxidase [Xenorhabdus sp. GDc328]